MTDARYQKLLDLMNRHDIPFVAINPGNTFRYLTQLDFHLMERPVVLLIGQSGENALILPHLEVSRAEQQPLIRSLFPYDDNPANWHLAFQAATQTLKIGSQIIAVEPNRFRFLETSFLQESCPKTVIRSGAQIFDRLRLIKDAQEIADMTGAAQIAESALQATLSFFKTGASERELASELVLQCLRAGADTEFPFPPIVAAGENSANPHATPTDRKTQAGDILLFDWGVCYNGYAADITRCFAIETLDAQMGEVAETVLAANLAGRNAGRPGIPAGDVDKATRAVITQGGYGAYFTHRTGHGLGMDAHEDPYIFAENDLFLQEGMVYTVEPGIYLTGQGGIRIEDNVVVTANGSQSLTTMDRAIKILP